MGGAPYIEMRACNPDGRVVGTNDERPGGVALDIEVGLAIGQPQAALVAVLQVPERRAPVQLHPALVGEDELASRLLGEVKTRIAG
ncbi:hypothetical protein D3C85_1651680 [compost metagenome]